MRQTHCGWLTLLAILGACAAPRPVNGGEGPAPVPLRLAAASDLQAALPALVKPFTRQTGIAVTLTFGASGQLAEQIKAGAPFDVFLAANQDFVKGLAEGGLIRPGSVRAYAVGSLVLAVNRESGGSIRGLADLARPEIKKVALANPAVAPYGAAGKQALTRSGHWAAVAPKVVQADTVRQALQFVQSGNAEAGLVGRAIANVPEIRVIEVDPKLYDPIVQGLGIVARSKKIEAAEAFSRFVLSAEGQQILSGFGFKMPPAAP